MKTFLVVVLFITLIITWISHCMVNGHKGIVMVDGYAHAVALCEGKPGDTEEMVTQKDEYHMWMDDGVLYTVNYGHLDDLEISELINRAQRECRALHIK